MEFPDDVLALIREYSRPLSRREVSKFWRDKNKELNKWAIINNTKKFNFDLDLMAVSVLNRFIEWGLPNAVLHRDGNIWKISGDTFPNITTFTDTDLLKWNGLICGEYDALGYCWNHEYLCEDPIIFKQLLIGTQVVKEKLISFYVKEKIKPRNRV